MADAPAGLEWQPIKLAPVGEEVWTKIHDERGERNHAKLTRHGNLWYTGGQNSMYVYYTPTHFAATSPRLKG